MIFNEHIAFLHVPKMGGMSITNFLLNNLPGDIHLVVPEASFDHAWQAVKFDDVRARLHLHAGERHERWHEAAALMAGLGFRLERFPKVLAVIRNPYTLERSHFQHLRKPATLKWRLGDGKEARIDTQLALDGDFGRFCQDAPFYGKLPSRIERYYTPDGRTLPGNLRLIRFESFEADLMREVEGFSLGRSPLGHENASGRPGTKVPPVDMSFDAESEAAVFRKFRFLFHFYERSDTGAVLPRADAPVSGPLPLSDDDRRAYVSALFAAVLHREPKEAEVAHWAGELAKDLDLVDLPARLAESSEFALIGRLSKAGPEADAGYVEALYRGMLHREPTGSERRRWLKALGGGLDPRRVPEHLGKTPEFEGLRQRLCAPPEVDEAFVRSLFAAVLHRPPKDSELGHWVGELGKGLDPRQLPARLSGSPEFAFIGRRAKAAPETDEQFIDLTFRCILHREPKDSERAHWRQALAGGLDPRRLIEHLGKAPELERLRRRMQADEAASSALARSVIEAVMRRPAREKELSVWTRELANGRPVSDLLTHLTLSPEFRRTELRRIPPAPPAPDSSSTASS